MQAPDHGDDEEDADGIAAGGAGGAVEAAADVDEEDKDADVPASDVYGRFTLDRRGNMDQVPLVVESGDGATNEDRGAGDAHILVPGPWADRQGTLNLHVRADGHIHDVVVVFKGTPDEKLTKARTKVIVDDVAFAKELGVHVIFQSKSWMDSRACNKYAKDLLAVSMGKKKRKAARGKEWYLLVVDNLGGQATESFSTLAREHAGVLVWLLPPNCTDLVQAVDSGVGAAFKYCMKLKYRAFMHDMHECGQLNLHVACKDWVKEGRPDIAAHQKVINSASFRRRMLVKWVAEVVAEFRANGERQDMIRRACVKTGLAVTVNGDDWDKIKPERSSGFKVKDPESGE